MMIYQGNPKHPGVSIAIAVSVDVQSGLSLLPEQVMKQGFKAIRSQLPESELPEIIILCDLLAIGTTIRIPGIKTIGIASQGDDEPILPLTVPCVTCIEGFSRSSANGEIVIVDGDSGTVYVDPDVQTIIRYQQASMATPVERFDLGEAHTPIVTQDGRSVVLGAVVRSIVEAEMAITNGADMLLVMFDEMIASETYLGRTEMDPQIEVAEMLIAMAIGMRVNIVMSDFDERLIAHIRRFMSDSEVIFSLQEDIPPVMPVTSLRWAVGEGATELIVKIEDIAAAKLVIAGIGQE